MARNHENFLKWNRDYRKRNRERCNLRNREYRMRKKAERDEPTPTATIATTATSSGFYADGQEFPNFSFELFHSLRFLSHKFDNGNV